ncbi:putative phage abortive infection protein, partial [Vibrio parahaemolyticus]|uniref:putative phage abortive infection protein n=1 Tax=Vibrio parahaemolyticus TaxID=670 RepID=UPI0015DF3841
REFWSVHDSELGHYFRFLYNIIKFLDESEHDAELYIKLLRAQLSDQELLILFYNSLTTQGQSFKKYIYKYHLLDNMPCAQLLKLEHQQYLEPKAFGD